jgi:hypothetical protein
MASTAIATLIKMMESLPESAQDQVVRHLRQYLQEMRDEEKWDRTFKKSQLQLRAAAQRARREIAQGRSKPLDHSDL